MGRTRERAWRNTEAPKKKLKQTQTTQRRPSNFLLDDDDDDNDDDGDVELLVQSRGPQAKFQSAAEGQTVEGQPQTVEDQANEGQTAVEQSVIVSQDEDKVQSTNSDVIVDQKFIKKCISPPSAQSLFGSTIYIGDCNRPGSPRNEKVLAEASKKIFSSVTSKAVDIITDQKEIDTGDTGKEVNVIDDDSPEWAQALEPVRKLPTKVGARIRRCIYDSLNRSPPEWAKEILEHSVSKEVYKGNASGPTKRLVISILEKVRVISQLKPTEEREKEEISYIMSKTKECAWRNTDTRIPKKKLKPTRKLLDDDGDVELLDPKQKHCELVENVSSLSDSLLDDDDDDDDDDDVVIFDLKQEQCELSENVSPMSDSLLDDDVEPLTSKQEHCGLVENLSPMSNSLEKYSSCQSDIVCVQGYKVKRSISTILEAIFKKYGDIAANCIFKTPATRIHFLEVVCEVVRQIQTNDMTEMVKDIECQVSDAEAANINVSWIRAHFEAFHKRKETSKRYNLLMGVKSNTILAKQAAQMDLRETCEELMSAQERFKNAERCESAASC